MTTLKMPEMKITGLVARAPPTQAAQVPRKQVSTGSISSLRNGTKEGGLVVTGQMTVKISMFDKSYVNPGPRRIKSEEHQTKTDN